ncbi:MAG: PIN domain-containing protein [Deltaproteobacteria bacterium]|nr:PIN domain-containing protein [Deltaproteobacteria bacterium]
MIFLDTSGLVALFDQRDSLHYDARAIWAAILLNAEPLVLSDLVVAETVTLLRRRAGFIPAERVLGRLLSGDVAEIVYGDSDLFDSASDLFARYRDKDLSLVDCVSFALMRKRRIRRAFSFDRDFRDVGFECVTTG